MSVSLVFGATLTATETLESNIPAAPAATRAVTHSAFNKSGTLTASTTPVAVTKCAYRDIAMTAGAVTIDLTALVGTNSLAQDGTGLKPQFVLFENVEGNAPITITEGASNGHALLGAGFQIILAAKQWVLCYLADAAPDVAAGDKTWDVTGTGTQSLRTAIILG